MAISNYWSNDQLVAKDKADKENYLNTKLTTLKDAAVSASIGYATSTAAANWITSTNTGGHWTLGAMPTTGTISAFSPTTFVPYVDEEGEVAYRKRTVEPQEVLSKINSLLHAIKVSTMVDGSLGTV